MSEDLDNWVFYRAMEIRMGGLPIEEVVDDLILNVKAHPHPDAARPLQVILVLMDAFKVSLGVAKGLTEIRCSEIEAGGSRDPERVRELYRDLTMGS